MTRRWPGVVLLPVLLVVGLVVDASREPDGRSPELGAAEATADLTRLMPVASGQDALSSTWYCAAGTAVEDGRANQTVVVHNPNDRPTTGTVTAVPSEGEPEVVREQVPPRGQVRVDLTDLVDAPYAAAIAEFRGGGVVVEHVTRGPLGSDAGPCATSASDRWYFASGTTTLDATETLVLFNPFPEAATVDIALARDGGRRRTPRLLQGLQVPASSVVPIELGKANSVGPYPQVSATVTARAGQVVAERIQTFNGEGAALSADQDVQDPFKPKGLAVTLGVPRAAPSWVFPYGAKGEGLHERIVVFNPSPDEAQIEVQVTLVRPRVNGRIEPFAVTVNPRSWTVVDLDTENRVPEEAGGRVAHTTTVRTVNRVPVVAERVLASTEPLESTDLAITPGTPLVSDRWIFAAGGATPGQLGELIAVVNPGSRAVEVRLGAVVDGQTRALGEGATFTLAAGQHARVRIDDLIEARAVTVQVAADGPVAAERILVRPGGARTSTALGVPAGGAGLEPVPPAAG
jgi:hypothetical protein